MQCAAGRQIQTRQRGEDETAHGHTVFVMLSSGRDSARRKVFSTSSFRETV